MFETGHVKSVAICHSRKRSESACTLLWSGSLLVVGKDSGQAGMTEKKRVQGEFSLMICCLVEQ